MLRLRCCALLLLQTVSFFLLALSVAAKSATGNRVLVIHEEDAVGTTFSQFFDSLQSNSQAYRSLTVDQFGDTN